MKKKVSVLLGILQLFVAIGAIPAGLSMICRPDGSGLGMSTNLLQNAPFHDFFIPGLFLFIVNGLINLASAILSFLKNKYTGLLGVCLGTILIAWICIQSYLIGLISFMQPMFFFIGLLEVIFAFLFIRQRK